MPSSLSNDDLYNDDILTLAASLRNGRLERPCGAARKTAKLCGSEIEIDVAMQGKLVSQCAMRVKACALGQASAAILYKNIIGASLDDICAGQEALRAMLKDGADYPSGRFGALQVLKGAGKYPARHASILLAFDAAIAAIKDSQEEIA
ncbi:MAG: iron-sulfur cluster assembly scaffold protein [Robiginitomaculum sp.]